MWQKATGETPITGYGSMMIGKKVKDMDSTSAKRFIRSLRHAEETIGGSAKCYCYTHEKEYQEIHEDIKLMIRLLEDGSHVQAGKLMYRRARQISPTAAYTLAEKAKSEEERRFYRFIGDMNSQKGEEGHGTEQIGNSAHL